ncbi:MAG: NAD(P)-dependent oxidoreductase [bacterium]|nr:NAD(P)-dependent oxidoreductase [bacterium]
MITLITEKKDYSLKAIAVYRSFGSVYFLQDIEKDKKKKREIMQKTNILVVRLAHTINKSWMDTMSNLKIIATNTTGLNHIDTAYAREKHVKVISLRGHTSFLKDIPSTAELTMALIFTLMRNIPWAHIHVSGSGSVGQRWNRDIFKGNQLFGKTLGIVGFGRLGKIVARYAKVFGMNVVAYDPYISRVSFGKIKKVSLDELCKRADIISLHASFDPEHPQIIFGEKEFEKMRSGAYFINTARGELIDEEAFLNVLKSNKLGGVALDVVANEREDGSHLRSGLGSWLRGRIQSSLGNGFQQSETKLILVPHLGGATYEAMQITEEFIADLVKKYFGKKRK